MNSFFAPCTNTVASLFLKSFWQTEGNPAYKVETILPKGEVELIFSFSGAADFCRNAVGHGSTPRCFINGISNMPVRLVVPVEQKFFGVVLQPAAVKKLLKAPSGNFLNAIIDLELVDKIFSSVWHQLAACESFEARVRHMQHWIIQKQPSMHQQEFELSGFLNSGDELHNVTQMAQRFCYSTRQLGRKVQELFGMSSEVVLRFRRYKQALNLVHHSTETLTRIAYAAGYYDQAHFNREFKEYTELTPGAYRVQKSSLTGHLHQ